MEIKRDYYLNKLVAKKHNGLIKVITGVRRCGKSYLLFSLFKKHLQKSGVTQLKAYLIHQCHCRGGYHPPARYKVKTTEMSGEFVQVSHIDIIQPNTQAT